jgi:hypothetical protein
MSSAGCGPRRNMGGRPEAFPLRGSSRRRGHLSSDPARFAANLRAGVPLPRQSNSAPAILHGPLPRGRDILGRASTALLAWNQALDSSAPVVRRRPRKLGDRRSPPQTYRPPARLPRSPAGRRRTAGQRAQPAAPRPRRAPLRPDAQGSEARRGAQRAARHGLEGHERVAGDLAVEEPPQANKNASRDGQRIDPVQQPAVTRNQDPAVLDAAGHLIAPRSGRPRPHHSASARLGAEFVAACTARCGCSAASAGGRTCRCWPPRPWAPTSRAATWCPRPGPRSRS